MPHLPEDSCAGLFLLNSFFPPRPYDIRVNYYLLYLIWFFSTGIFDGYLPEWAVMRYMAPEVTTAVIQGYSVPYHRSIKTKASVSRFSHIVPGIPDMILSFRSTYLWRLIEGLCGPERFTNINAQAWLATRNSSIRHFWASPSQNKRPAVAVAFGHDDPLLPDFKGVLTATIDPALLASPRRGVWIPRAGHYPVEGKPTAVAELISKFAISGVLV